MPRPNSFLSAGLILLILSVASARLSAQATGSQENIGGLDPVIHELCGRHLALIGESPVHGFGRTLEFKVELVRKLVDECQYNAFFIESGTYDFIHIEKSRKSGSEVRDAMISAAIGGLWHNQEMQALIPFLRDRVKSGRLTLGGLDDQIGAGTYASHGMASDLAQYLHGDDRSRCLGILQKHLAWQYTDQAPYGPSDKEKIIGCLNRIEKSIPEPDATGERSTSPDKVMIESFKRELARDFTEDDFRKHDQEVKWINDRDRSMYLNFKWLYSQLPPHSKVIIWTATVHAAKELTGIQGFEKRVPMGYFLRRDFGDRAFSLGFSAYSGEYAFVHQPVRQLPVAPDSSLEGQSFAHTGADTVYLSRDQLARFGKVASRALGLSPESARWNKVLDGLLIFRKEHAPEWLQQ